MFKKIAFTAFATLLSLQLSAGEDEHRINFEEIKFEASGRNARHVVSTAAEPVETFTYLYGKAKLVDGKFGTALDFSDTRSRTELRLRTGRFYDHNEGTISFWLSPQKENFGVKGEVIIFEESNGDTKLALYMNEKGNLVLKVFGKFPLEEKDTSFEDTIKEIENEDKLPKYKQKDVIEDLAKEKKAEEEAAKKALEEAKKPKFRVEEFPFVSYDRGNVSRWKVGEWNHISVTYNLRKGFFGVLVNGKFVIRSFAAQGDRNGIFIDRGDAGKYIVFGPGNNGFSAAIDNISVGKSVKDFEFKLSAKNNKK